MKLSVWPKQKYDDYIKEMGAKIMFRDFFLKDLGVRGVVCDDKSIAIPDHGAAWILLALKEMLEPENETT